MTEQIVPWFVQPVEVQFEPYPAPPPPPAERARTVDQNWSGGEGMGRGVLVGGAAAITAMLVGLVTRDSLTDPAAMIGILVMYCTVAGGIGAALGCAVGGLLTLIARGGGPRPLLRVLGGGAVVLPAAILTAMFGSNVLPAVVAAGAWGTLCAPWVAIHPFGEDLR